MKSVKWKLINGIMNGSDNVPYWKRSVKFKLGSVINMFVIFE